MTEDDYEYAPRSHPIMSGDCQEFRDCLNSRIDRMQHEIDELWRQIHNTNTLIAELTVTAQRLADLHAYELSKAPTPAPAPMPGFITASKLAKGRR